MLVFAASLIVRFDHAASERSLICVRKAGIRIVGFSQHQNPQPIDGSALVGRANPWIEVALA